MQTIDKLLDEIRVLRNEVTAFQFVGKSIVVRAGSLEHKIFDAITANNIELVRSIIEKARTPNIYDVTNTSALHFAVMMERIEIVKFIIRKGGDINTRTSDQRRSPLYSAYALGNIHLINILEEMGAVKVRDKWKWFPIQNGREN